jgi:hypothetical protein
VAAGFDPWGADEADLMPAQGRLGRVRRVLGLIPVSQENGEIRFTPTIPCEDHISWQTSLSTRVSRNVANAISMPALPQAILTHF